MDLKTLLLSEVSQTEKEKYHRTSLCVESKKKWYKWTYLQNRLLDLEKELMVAVGEGIARDFGKVMYTLLYLKMDNQQRPIA